MSDTTGRLYVGTSGFAYPSWVPRFYAPGRASRKLLEAYAARLPAVELNSTFYKRPPREQVDKWLRETPATFRFCPKVQRGTSWRAWSGKDPRASFEWTTNAFAAFGERIGPVLLSARGSMERDDEALERVLRAWPGALQLAIELPHPSWDARAVRVHAGEAGVAIAAADWNDRAEPGLETTGAFVYLRLRRTSYSPSDLDRWSDRIEAVLDGGRDAYVFFRHDEDGQMALHAESLWGRLERYGVTAGNA